jgi:AraC-like DNA-binding protein
VEFAFVARRPSGPLEPWVEQVWSARGTIGYRRELIAPTGSCVAVVVLGPPIVETPLAGRGVPVVAADGFLIGPHDGPVVNQPTAETFALGVVTTPLGCGPVLGQDAARLRGAVVDLAVAWPDLADLRARLLVATRAGADPDALLDLLVAHLEHRLAGPAPGLDRCAAAVALLDADPGREIADVARRLGISHGHLDRVFLRHVGLTPRAYARIARLRAVLAGVDVFGSVTWADVAADAGWFDQSHFIRDFKRHTGVTPSAYLRAQRAEFTADDAAPGFVPER